MAFLGAGGRRRPVFGPIPPCPRSWPGKGEPTDASQAEGAQSRLLPFWQGDSAPSRLASHTGSFPGCGRYWPADEPAKSGVKRKESQTAVCPDGKRRARRPPHQDAANFAGGKETARGWGSLDSVWMFVISTYGCSFGRWVDLEGLDGQASLCYNTL